VVRVLRERMAAGSRTQSSASRAPQHKRAGLHDPEVAAFPRAASRASGATSAETNISSPSPAISEGSAPPAAPNAPPCGWNSSGSR
jgi:hypothetical protein